MQGVRAPGLSFPQALTQFVADGMASSAPAERTSAHVLGSAALQQVEGQLPDSQSALLLTAAWEEVRHMTVHKSTAMAALQRLELTAWQHGSQRPTDGLGWFPACCYVSSPLCDDIRCFYAFAGCLCWRDTCIAGIAGQPPGRPAQSSRAARQNTGTAVGAVSQKRYTVPGESPSC